jgi:hypothetical protein
VPSYRLLNGYGAVLSHFDARDDEDAEAWGRRADATWAVDQLSVGWNQQAALKAAEYLDYTSFSRQGLVDQLVFEGFTPAEAEFGASQAYDG